MCIRDSAVFAPIVFLPTAFVFTAAFLGAGFFADFFLGIALFLLASSFFGVAFLPTVLVAFAGLFLDFFLATIRAVYHRHPARSCTEMPIPRSRFNCIPLGADAFVNDC